MCGRYETGQKQKTAEAFHVSVNLEDFYFSLGTEAAPGSIQPVIYMRDGQREVAEMRWGFKLLTACYSMRDLKVLQRRSSGEKC